ncbi:MAG: NUDIX hydrolase [bacterium]|nr:NUDIX hydrolase [bacterium]
MRINGPWKIKSSQEKYSNEYFKVNEDQVIRPDGKDGILSRVELRPGASALPIDDNGFVYLIRQFRYTIEDYSIEVAGGGMVNGEKPIEAAKRELKEELGIEAKEWIDLGRLNPFTTAIKSPHYIFLVKKLKFGKTIGDPTEDIKPMKVTLEQAVNMVMDGKITNGPSCVLILKVEKYLKDKYPM